MCSSKGFLKRLVPFFLTFAVGLFIASFFVSVAAPNFQFPNRSSRKKHREYDRQLQLENQRLRDENQRLRNQSADLESSDYRNLRFEVPAPPAPPAPPTVQSVPRSDR